MERRDETREDGPEEGRGGGPTLRQVFDRYYRPVLAFFLRRGFSKAESEDLAQETFIRVSRGLEDLRSEEALGGWILRIAANVWKNELRHWSTKKRDALEVSYEGRREAGEPLPEGSVSFGAGGMYSPQSKALDAERLSLVRGEIEAMGPKMRRCLLLHAVQGYKYREIATLLQVSIQTVKSHIHQGRRRLRDALEEKLTEGTR